MRRLIVISDTHGRAATFERICLLHPEAERILFLGDGAGDFEYVKSRHPEWAMMGVSGNCDYSGSLPDINVCVVGEWRLLMIHGHDFAVKGTDSYMLDEARKRSCNAVLYGHTHKARCEKVDGIWLLNPGAVMDYHIPHYALLDLGDNGKFIANLAEFSFISK